MPKDDDLLKYHIARTDDRFTEVNTKLDRLMVFMWLLIGISVGMSSAGSKLFEIAVAMAGGK